jgi:hypothetical protein
MWAKASETTYSGSAPTLFSVRFNHTDGRYATASYFAANHPLLSIQVYNPDGMYIGGDAPDFVFRINEATVVGILEEKFP